MFNFIILTDSGKPKYSSFKTIVDKKQTIKLTRYILNELKKLMSLNYETSGYLYNKLDTTAIYIAMGDKYSTPKLPYIRDTLSFHVHPNFLYDDLKTNIGWPSMIDAINMPNQHLVISKEGIYLTNISKCTPPKKTGKKFSTVDLKNVLNDCKWVLFPWKLAERVYIFVP